MSSSRCLLLFGIAFFVGVDLIEDYFSGLSLHHFLVHVVMLGLAIAHGVILWRRLRALLPEVIALDRDLTIKPSRYSALAAGGERRDPGHGRGDPPAAGALAAQRSRTAVALLLLRGLSHKEIANLRKTSETTVRQQAPALYRKSGLSGRNELSGFFLEDLVTAALAPVPTAVRPHV